MKLRCKCRCLAKGCLMLVHHQRQSHATDLTHRQPSFQTSTPPGAVVSHWTISSRHGANSPVLARPPNALTDPACTLCLPAGLALNFPTLDFSCGLRTHTNALWVANPHYRTTRSSHASPTQHSCSRHTRASTHLTKWKNGALLKSPPTPRAAHI